MGGHLEGRFVIVDHEKRPFCEVVGFDITKYFALTSVVVVEVGRLEWSRQAFEAAMSVASQVGGCVVGIKYGVQSWHRSRITKRYTE